MTLSEQASTIRSREDLAAFVRSLHNDFHDNRQMWENDTLDRFLDALAAWVEDMGGYYRKQRKELHDHPAWKTLADMLIAARQYE